MRQVGTLTTQPNKADFNILLTDFFKKWAKLFQIVIRPYSSDRACLSLVYYYVKQGEDIINVSEPNKRAIVVVKQPLLLKIGVLIS